MADASALELHDGEFWELLLTRVDAELTAPAALLVIGGAAIGLGHCRAFLTRDLDTISPMGGELGLAVGKACRELQTERGLRKLPEVSYSAVCDAPEAYDARCSRLLPNPRFLQVSVPERHDLAMMKVARGDERDLEALRTLHKVEPFNFETLLERYGEMQFGGAERKFNFHFCLFVDRLYGERAAELVMAWIETPGNCPGHVLPAAERRALAEKIAAVAEIQPEPSLRGPKRGPARGPSL